MRLLNNKSVMAAMFHQPFFYSHSLVFADRLSFFTTESTFVPQKEHFNSSIWTSNHELNIGTHSRAKSLTGLMYCDF